jgi:serine/threonine protein kinase
MMAVDRKLYCVAIHPVGRPMQDYRTPLEVLEAFRDIVKGHQSLYIDGQILHRDVSKDNIMITSNPEEGAPKGFLIDLDVSQRLDDNNPKKPGRHGTRPFMAMGVLLGKEHTYRHDLESLFYCFLWIAISGQGKAWPREGSKLWEWLKGGFEECALRKGGDMEPEGLERTLDEFATEFIPHKAFAREWWRLFPPAEYGLVIGSDKTSNDPRVLSSAMLKAVEHAIHLI